MMVKGNMEERLKILEDTIQKQAKIIEEQGKKVQMLDDINEVQKLMSRYVYMHEVGRDPEFTDLLFAKKTPGVSWEVAHMGYFTGRDGIKKVLDAHGIMSKGPGKMFIHTLTTPVIEIAGDGKTAKGVWISPGAETITDEKTKKPLGAWAWTKYGCDFVKEDGEWKLWHYHVYRILLIPCGRNYTEDFEKKAEPGEPSLLEAFGIKPNGGPSYDNPYTTTFTAKMVPAPPEPYETFSETFSYGP
jgi:hypothetical protein